MPIISTDTFSFDGCEYKKQVRCNSRGEFSITLPPTVIEKLAIKEVKGNTIREVLDAWYDTIEGYKKSQTEKRKVIAYEVQANDDISFAHGMSLSIWARVFIESKTDIPNKQPVYDYDDVDFEEMLPSELQTGGVFDVGRIEEKIIIDWTPARHEFFVAIHKAMTTLINKVQKLHSKKKLLEIADSGTKLLENI